MLLKTQLHSFVHEMGFVLDTGARIVLHDFLERAEFATVWIDEDETQLRSLEPNDRTPQMSTAATHILRHACVLAEMHGRRKVMARDVAFLCDFWARTRALVNSTPASK